MAGPDRPISTLGGEARLGRVDGDERVERGVAAPDPLEERLHRVDGESVRAPKAWDSSATVAHTGSIRLIDGLLEMSASCQAK